MNKGHKELISMGLTIAIVASALFIVHHFIPSLVWACIIVIATYPLYNRWRNCFGSWNNVSALLFTLIIVLLFILPLSWLVSVLVKETQVFVNYLQLVNRNGGETPWFLKKIPLFGDDMVRYWNSNLTRPGNIKHVLSNVHLALMPTSYYIKQISFNLAHRSFQVGFTLLSLFFFYRDGDVLLQQINQIGVNCLGTRWYRYANRLPAALRATVNGTIVVGFGVGALMGACYGLLNLPGPTLLGFVTALAAMIPFVAPALFAVIALVVFFNGSMIGALFVIGWGTLVLFVADHFIKPVLIGGAIQLPFRAVLFSILGGVETLGLLGLFVGPMVLVLFMTLWYESQHVTATEAAFP